MISSRILPIFFTVLGSPQNQPSHMNLFEVLQNWNTWTFRMILTQRNWFLFPPWNSEYKYSFYFFFTSWRILVLIFTYFLKTPKNKILDDWKGDKFCNNYENYHRYIARGQSLINMRCKKPSERCASTTKPSGALSLRFDIKAAATLRKHPFDFFHLVSSRRE